MREILIINMTSSFCLSMLTKEKLSFVGIDGNAINIRNDRELNVINYTYRYIVKVSRGIKFISYYEET